MPAGRPETYTRELGDSLSESLPDMFIDGQSVAEVCAELKMCKDSFYKLCEVSDKFSDAYKKGQGLSEAWWTKLGREGSTGKAEIQPTTWIFNMKNRFAWADKQDQTISGPGGGAIKTDNTWRVEVVSSDET